MRTHHYLSDLTDEQWALIEPHIPPAPAGHLLQPTTEVKALFIGGKPMAPESRHTRLYAEYAKRLEEVKWGSAPIGLDRPRTTASTPSTTSATQGQDAGGNR